MLVRPYQSKIPDAIDAIVAAFTAAFTDSDPRVFVRDGPWLASESGGGYAQDMAVGWSGFYPGYQYPTRSLSEELGEAAVTATNNEEGWAPAQEETFTAGCASMVLSGTDPKASEWSKLRRMAYGNIATAAAYMATPEAGQLYLNDTVMKLVIGRTNSCHPVSQRRGLLCIVAFSLEAVAISQQLPCRVAPPAFLAGRTLGLLATGPGNRSTPLATYTLQSPPHAGAQLTFVTPASGDLVKPGQGVGLLVLNPTGNGTVTPSLPMPTSDGVTVGPRTVACAAASATPTVIPLPSTVYGTAPIAITYTGTLTTVQVALITIP